MVATFFEFYIQEQISLFCGLCCLNQYFSRGGKQNSLCLVCIEKGKIPWNQKSRKVMWRQSQVHCWLYVIPCIFIFVFSEITYYR